MVALDKKAEGQNLAAKGSEFRSDSRRLDRHRDRHIDRPRERHSERKSDRQAVLARSNRSSGRQLKFDWDSLETKPANWSKSKTTTNSTVAPNSKDSGNKEPLPVVAEVASEPKVQQLGQTSPTALTSQAVPTSQAHSLNTAVAKTSRIQPAAAGAMRIGQTAKLGVVMMRLLKSYGITDEEIIEAFSIPTIS